MPGPREAQTDTEGAMPAIILLSARSPRYRDARPGTRALPGTKAPHLYHPPEAA